MNAKSLPLIGTVLAVVLFLSVNLTARPLMRGMRADLTEQKLYTLSEGTRNILGGLSEDINLRYYFAKTVAEESSLGIVAYADRVREMLEQYEAASNGKVSLQVIDPVPFSEEEEQAVRDGIRGQRVSLEGDKFYIGLVGSNSVGEDEVIEILEPGRESSLEYEISQLVDKLENPERPVIGLLSSLALRGGPAPLPPGLPPEMAASQPQRQLEPWNILQLLEGRYELRELTAEGLTEVPGDVDVLLLLHPKGLSEEAVYAIDQYAVGGGSIAAFVDPFSFFDPASAQAMGAPTSESDNVTGIDRLLNSWGLEVPGDRVAGDSTLGVRIASRSDRPVTLPIYFNITGDTLNGDDIVSSSVTSLMMLGPGAMQIKESLPEGLEVIPLALTTESGGGTVLKSRMTGTEEQIAEAFMPSGKAMTLAARVSGTIASAFPGGLGGAAPQDGPEDEPENAPESPEVTNSSHLETSKSPFNAVVFADVDMLHDNLWATRSQSLFGGTTVRSKNGNAPMLLGALENLTGSNDLISLRSREAFRRPFTRKEELQKDADAKFAEEDSLLQEKLAAAEARINELQSQKDPESALFLSPEQEEEIERYRAEQVETQRNLRRVKKNLQASIKALGTRLKFLNILLIPAIIAALCLSWRLARRGPVRA